MVTTYSYSIPCSCCGNLIPVVGKRFCSGACKVKAFRDKEEQTQTFDPDVEPVTEKLQPRKVTPKLHKKVFIADLPFSKHGQSINELPRL